jgi:hypothetical protein
MLGELVTGKPLMPGGENEVDQLCRVVSMVGQLSLSQEQLLGLLPWEQRSKLEAARGVQGPLLDRCAWPGACTDVYGWGVCGYMGVDKWVRGVGEPGEGMDARLKTVASECRKMREVGLSAWL